MCHCTQEFPGVALDQHRTSCGHDCFPRPSDGPGSVRSHLVGTPRLDGTTAPAVALAHRPTPLLSEPVRSVLVPEASASP
jgi:hypothetical protein